MSLSRTVRSSLIAAGCFVAFTGCDRPSPVVEPSETERVREAEQQAATERVLRLEAEQRAQQSQENAQRAYSMTGLALAGGVVALVVGGVVGIALGTRARRSASRLGDGGEP